MALCSNCGGKIKEGVRFCPSCGKPAVNTGYPPGYKPKDWTTTLLLCIFLGWLGGHRFYVGKIGTAILNIIVTAVTFGIGSFIWFIIDLIKICTFKFKDKHGYPLKHKSMINVPALPSTNIKSNGGSVYDKAESVESAAQNLPEQESEIKISPEKNNEFITFMQNLIEANSGQLTGDGIYWENIPEKICINATKAHAIPNGESILMVFDETIMGSGKTGMVFTDWGISYKSRRDAWRLSWNDISEKYILVKTRTGDTFMIKPDGLLLQTKSSDSSATNKPIYLSAYIGYDILATIIDKSCQIFTGRRVELLDNTVINKYLRKREANGFLDYLQEENKSGTLGTNAILNTGPSKQIENFSGTLNMLDDEEIIALFKSIQKGSGENGLAFTSWGVRYRDNVNQKKWDVSWKELGEKCTFHNEESKSFRISSKQDGLASYEIDLKPYIPNADILEVLLLNGCMIMNGKDPYAVDPEAYETDVEDVDNQSEPEEDDDDDEIKYRVYNYGSGNIPSYGLDSNQLQEFQLYIKKAITENDLDGIKSRSILNLGASNEIRELEAEYVSTKNEKLIFFFDISPDGTRDYGVALTNIGIQYRFYGTRKFVTWKQLAEEYAIRIDAGVEIVEPNSVLDEDADPVMSINYSQSNDTLLAGEWLFDIICKGCDIFTGTTSQVKHLNKKEEREHTETCEYVDNGNSGGDGSFFIRNIGGIILAVIMSVLIFCMGAPLSGIIALPLSFLGCVIGNKLRLWLHPDFVIASGFFGLLKERIFWRFIPQFIGALIGLFIAGAIAGGH